MSTICKLDPTVRRERSKRKRLRRLAWSLAQNTALRPAERVRLIGVAMQLERAKGRSTHDKFMAIWTKWFGEDSARAA